MTKFLLYTFKNFPYKDSITQFSPFEFHKLMSDLEVFSGIIKKTKPMQIIGVAKSVHKNSYFETKTINVFNKTKKVDQQGKKSYSLNHPHGGYKSITLNLNTTDSFCNWTMYKISQIIESQNINLQFIHISKLDMGMLEEYLASLQ